MHIQNALVAYYKARQVTPEMKAFWKDGIYFVNKLKVILESHVLYMYMYLHVTLFSSHAYRNL